MQLLKNHSAMRVGAVTFAIAIMAGGIASPVMAQSFFDKAKDALGDVMEQNGSGSTSSGTAGNSAVSANMDRGICGHGALS